jgi:HPt (histidine-containing phosphotransfer) domain-containing protein
VDAKHKDAGRCLDLRILDAMCATPGRYDDPVLTNLIALFLREETARVASLAPLASARDLGSLAKAAHKLAGSAAVIGANPLMEAAQKLERLALEGDRESVGPQLDRACGAWTELLAALASLGFRTGP